MDDTDGINDTFEHTLRTAMMAAARAGEMLARLREQQLRQAQARSQHDAAQVQARFRAEQAAARAHYGQTRDPAWWDRASVDDVVDTYQTAASWKDADLQAQAAMDHIEREAKTRHNVDLPGAAASAGAADRAHHDADNHNTDARREEREAADLLAAANAADRQARAADTAGDPAAADQSRDTAADLTSQGRVGYDSAQRRHHDAERLSTVADAETIDAKIRADTSQAHPATHATHTTPGRGTRKAVRSNTASKQRTPHRGR